MFSLRLIICAAVLSCGVTDVSAQFFGVQQQQDWVAMWAFNGRTEEQVQKQLKSDYKMQLKMIDRICDLQEQQTAKMTTAGEADVSRFFREVAKVRKEVEALDIKGNNNNEINKIWPIVTPIAQQMQQGIFADKSLFQKVMRSTLSKEQRDLYDAELEKNRRRKWKSVTRVNLVDIEKSMPLLGDQREKLLELLDAQRLPKKINKSMDGYVGYLKLLKAKRQDKNLGGILDKQQMAVIDQYCDKYRGWENMVK